MSNLMKQKDIKNQLKLMDEVENVWNEVDQDKIDTLLTSAWRHAFTLLGKKYFAFFSAPAFHVLLGERQKYRAENALPKALSKKRKAQKDHEKKGRY